MTIVVQRRWDQWSTYENDRRFLKPQQRVSQFTRVRPHASRWYSLYTNRLGKWTHNPIVRK